MELRKLIEDLNVALYDAMCEGCRDDESFTGSIETPSSQIDVFLRKKGWEWLVEVTVYHDHDYMRETPNLEKFLEDNIEVDWAAVEESWREDSMDEYQRNGFASEADFWRWKEGRL